MSNTCGGCNGAGKVPNGRFGVMVCGRCHGTGKVPDRDKLLKDRNELMALVDAEREANKKNGVKHLSQRGIKILNCVWDLDEKIMELT